jgi:hypothetical protein
VSEPLLDGPPFTGIDARLAADLATLCGHPHGWVWLCFGPLPVHRRTEALVSAVARASGASLSIIRLRFGLQPES